MPKFEIADPGTIHIGRGKLAAEMRAVYREQIADARAGRIILDRGDKPSTVKRILADASKELGMRVRSGWEDPKTQRVLLWKLVGA